MVWEGGYGQHITVGRRITWIPRQTYVAVVAEIWDLAGIGAHISYFRILATSQPKYQGVKKDDVERTHAHF